MNKIIELRKIYDPKLTNKVLAEEDKKLKNNLL
jgi:hypothetical protein